jgi:transcription initiation factor TFIIIB Brf1 subunit/transcription initiation factor TFIIB
LDIGLICDALRELSGLLHKNRIDEQLKLSIQKRLLTNEDTELSRCGRILDSNNWPAKSKDNIVYEEQEIRTLVTRFQLSEREPIRAFREYIKYREEMPKELSRIRRVLHTIAISFSECER